jgi:hypothetical protein
MAHMLLRLLVLLEEWCVLICTDCQRAIMLANLARHLSTEPHWLDARLRYDIVAYVKTLQLPVNRMTVDMDVKEWVHCCISCARPVLLHSLQRQQQLLVQGILSSPGYFSSKRLLTTLQNQAA